jgi:serine/threonine protein kinase
MDEDARIQNIKIIESETIIIDRFSNIKRLGKNGGNGNFSIMFTAKDQQTGDNVALKFYDPAKMDNADRYKRFERETDMLLFFKDEPMVLNCFSNGVCFLEKTFIDSKTKFKFRQKFPFIPLELADHSIEDLIYAKKTDALRLLYAFKEITKAVFRVHSRVVCHRDLKPSNFLVINKRVCLSDFGTAKNMAHLEEQIRTEYSIPVGDFTYNPPELFFAIGIADDIVFQSDIFSLGAILFEMFTKDFLTSQIYTKKIFANLLTTLKVVEKMTVSKRIATYNAILPDLENMIYMPDIYSYNDNVPGCIKLQLDDLYKSLTKIDYKKRINKPESIHRKIDICIKTLKNEKKYSEWKIERDRRREIRLMKLAKRTQRGQLR